MARHTRSCPRSHSAHLAPSRRRCLLHFRQAASPRVWMLERPRRRCEHSSARRRSAALGRFLAVAGCGSRSRPAARDGIATVASLVAPPARAPKSPNSAIPAAMPGTPAQSCSVPCGSHCVCDVYDRILHDCPSVPGRFSSRGEVHAALTSK